jgi:hypothetical protein
MVSVLSANCKVTVMAIFTLMFSVLAIPPLDVQLIRLVGIVNWLEAALPVMTNCAVCEAVELLKVKVWIVVLPSFTLTVFAFTEDVLDSPSVSLKLPVLPISALIVAAVVSSVVPVKA